MPTTETYKVIKLNLIHKRKLKSIEVKIDLTDVEIFNSRKWGFDKDSYLRASDGDRISLHRLLCKDQLNNDKDNNLVVDHINHDLYDNRRANLRVCLGAENKRNKVRLKGGSSKYKGVSIQKTGNWRVDIWKRNKRVEKSEYFKYEIEAAIKYDEWAKKHYGQFAYLNFKTLEEQFLACQTLASLKLLEAKQEYSPGGVVDDARNGGDPPAPTPMETMDSVMGAYNKWAGPLAEQAIKYLPEFERGLFDVKQEQAPLEQALQAQLYEQYAPQMNRVGRDIANENRVDQDRLDRQLAPEYYNTIGNSDKLLQELTGQVMRNNTSDSLTGGETEEMQRYLNRQNNQQGNLNTQSGLTTASNAMQFGQANRNRQMQNQGALSNAIAQATGAAPGMNAKFAKTDFAGDKFTGIPQVGQQYFGMQNNLFGNTNQAAQQSNQINAQRRDGLDRVAQFIPLFG